MWNRIRNIKGLADISAVGIANIGGTAISAIFWIYMAAVLGPEKYGEINYFISIALIAAVFCQFGSGYALTVYTAKKQDLLWPVMIISAGSSIIAAIALYLMFKEPSVSLYMAGFVIFVLGDATLLGRKMYRKYSMTSLLQKACLVALAISLYYVMGPIGIVVGIGLSMMIFVWPLIRFSGMPKIGFAGLAERFRFTTSVYAEAILRMLDGQLDKLIIAQILGFAVLGSYHFGLQIISILTILPSIIFQYALPQDASGNTRLVMKRTVVMASAALSVLGILLAPAVIPALFPKFADAVLVVQIMCLSVVPRAIIFMLSSKFLGMEKGGVVLLATLVSLATLIPLIYVLGWLYESTGIAIALVIANTSSMAVFLIKNRILEQEDTL